MGIIQQKGAKERKEEKQYPTGWGERPCEPHQAFIQKSSHPFIHAPRTSRALPVPRHRPAEIQNRHLRPRLLLASASRLQELHDADESARMVGCKAGRTVQCRFSVPQLLKESP
jgi:hypothetical protein